MNRDSGLCVTRAASEGSPEQPVGIHSGLLLLAVELVVI